MAPQEIPFTKMHGTGNDFVVVAASDLVRANDGLDVLKDWKPSVSQLAQVLCDRRFGVGADGLILVAGGAGVKTVAEAFDYPNWQDCEVAWTYTNGDGSPSLMCGNGLRCVALMAVLRKMVKSNTFKVATACGPIDCHVESPEQITINFGQPIFKPADIPMSGIIGDKFVSRRLANLETVGTCLSMGNPHCVVFIEQSELDAMSDTTSMQAPNSTNFFPAKLAQSAQQIQKLPLFPEGVNVEFVIVEAEDKARVLVWERGCGATLACASGAAAAVVAGVLEGKLKRVSTIVLPGGPLTIEWSDADHTVKLTGPACEVYKGTAGGALLELCDQSKPKVHC